MDATGSPDVPARRSDSTRRHESLRPHLLAASGRAAVQQQQHRVQTGPRYSGWPALLLDDPQRRERTSTTALAVARKIGIGPRSRFSGSRSHGSCSSTTRTSAAAAVEHLNEATREAQAMKMKPLLDECLALKLRFQGISDLDRHLHVDRRRRARASRREKPDLASHAAPDGTVTIMFSDIEDSTVLTERLGDQAWQELLRKHNALIREQLQRARRLRSEDDGRRLHGRLPVREEGPRLRHRHPARVRRAQRRRRRAREGAHRPPRRRGDQGRRRLLRQERDHGLARRRQSRRRRDPRVVTAARSSSRAASSPARSASRATSS